MCWMDIHLPSLIGNVTRSARAWRTVSTEGASRCVSVSNVVVTLSEHRLPTAPSPVPSLLGALNDEGTESLEWLRDAVKRLARIAQGVDDALGALAAVETAVPVVWSLTARQWHRLVAVVAGSMRADLRDKRESLMEIEKACRGEGFDRQALELGAAQWLEQPHLRECDVDVLAAALDTEIEAKRVQDLAGVERKSVEVVAEKATMQKDMSPAMAMLLGKKLKTSRGDRAESHD